MDFESLISTLMSPPEDGLPDTIYDDLRATYADASGRADSAAAKIEALTAENTSMIEEISRLKAANYDLLTAVPSPDNTSSSDGDSSDDDSDDNITINDLFDDKEGK